VVMTVLYSEWYLTKLYQKAIKVRFGNTMSELDLDSKLMAQQSNVDFLDRVVGFHGCRLCFGRKSGKGFFRLAVFSRLLCV